MLAVFLTVPPIADSLDQDPRHAHTPRCSTQPCAFHLAADSLRKLPEEARLENGIIDQLFARQDGADAEGNNLAIRAGELPTWCVLKAIQQRGVARGNSTAKYDCFADALLLIRNYF